MHWTQGEFARDQHNTAVDFKSEAADKWCASGAIISDVTVSLRAFNLLDSAATVLCGLTVGPVHVNDRLGHAKVMEMYDLAIKMAGRDDS